MDALETEKIGESRLIEAEKIEGSRPIKTEKTESLELLEAEHSLRKATGGKDRTEKDCDKTSYEKKSLEPKQRKFLLYRLVESSCNNREISRLHRTRCFGLMRSIVDKIGEKTIGFDVYYLSLEELEEMLFTGKDFSLKIAREKELRKAYERLPVLSRVKLLGKVDRDPLAGEITVLNYGEFKTKGSKVEKSEKAGNDEIKVKSGQGEKAGAMGKSVKSSVPFWEERGNFESKGKTKSAARVFFGRGVSKGIFRGEVLKIKSLQEVRATEAKGKILLSYSTDPGWFPYLNMAEGLITERGSLLSHSAILARELEKPAVVNIPNIMEELQSGDIVEIDGDLGICSVITQKEK